MVQKPINVNQDLLGYRLKDRIGAGGYGEVWSAEAPGGIMKAIKIVFGYHDERRAQNELRSLDRIKSLRHPFLLNLERIDIVDGQLVIITELADKSLADEFNDFVMDGEMGIPREYLLNQLIEAADALDYISEKHSLQHLDIKPENLLLVGRHIKVADFGLVKDLQDVSQSLMGGLTPAYAAPELFDGRPSTSSDQYSLAIVFQEMLTGQRPFPGTTPAALAAQHMNGKPNLRPLPKSDQLVISKALSKDSNVRFPNCVAMIEELISRHSVTKSPKRKFAPTRKVQDTECREIKVRSGINRTEATQLLNKSVYQDVPSKTIDAPDCSELPCVLKPTLFIGIGNSANQVLRKLRQRAIERFGNLENIPAFKLICIDTDRHDLTNLSRMNDGFDLSASETLALPLRKPEDYRTRQKSILNWLSRRWIYNVPKTLKTEGIRPLGRLALIDNFESIFEKLQSTIEELAKPELLAKSAENIGMEPGSVEPDVFIVSSISGGSGSGMMNDVAYVTRLVLSEYGKPRDRIRGIMMHSTAANVSDPGLAAANSFAFLTELRHFTQFGYPGDDSKGLPELPDEAPFESSYFLDLGNDLSLDDLDAKFDNVAEYLFLNSLSKSNRFFTKCRDLESEIEHFALRSFGLASYGLTSIDCYQGLVEQLCQQLLSKWTKGSRNSSELAIEVFKAFDHSRIDCEKVMSEISTQTLSFTHHHDVSSLRASLNAKFSNQHQISTELLSEEIEQVFGDRRSQNSLNARPDLCQTLTVWVNSCASENGKDISELLGGLLKQSRLDLHACLMSTAAFRDFIGSQRDLLRKTISAQLSRVEQLEDKLLRWHSQHGHTPNEKPLDSLVESYLEANIEELKLRYTEHFFRSLSSQIGNLHELFTQYAQQLETTVGSSFYGKVELEGVSPIEVALANRIQSQLPSLVGSVELQLFHNLIEEHGGYSEVLDDANCLNYLIPEKLRQIAQVEVASATKRLDIDLAIQESELGEKEVSEWLKSLNSDAGIYLDECGGEVRQAIISPSDAESPLVASRVSDPEQPRRELISGSFGDLIVVSEGEDIPLANVAFRLLQFRPDCLELTKRLYTRSDIDWISLEEIL